VIRLDQSTDWPAVLRKLLDRQGLTQSELARQTGISVQQINGWLTGDRAPGRTSLITLAAALDVDLALVRREDA
jgi:transcriptional regulator with XRE-family HTH domain